MIPATTIEFIKNLALYDYENRYYDFHNDYRCERLTYCDGILTLDFKGLASKSIISLKFIDVSITMMTCFSTKELEGLIIDTLYRGRIEINGGLKEISIDEKAYFYLEFYEGQKLEFWAKSIDIKEE